MTLSDAFMTDPALGYIVPDEAARAKALPKLFTLLVADDSEKGTAMRSGNDEAAALWRAPGMAKDAGGTSLTLIWNMLRIFGFAIPRASMVADALHPTCPTAAIIICISLASEARIRAKAGAVRSFVKGWRELTLMLCQHGWRRPRPKMSRSTSGSALSRKLNGISPREARISGG